MMKWSQIICAALLLAFPAGAKAQTVTIRSGEHATFTRLVFSIPEGTVWQIGRSDGGYDLRFDSEDLIIDTRGVFDRVPRERLTALAVEDGRAEVELQFSCDCHVDAFLYNAGQLVVDLISGPAPDGAEFEMVLDGDVPAPSPVIQYSNLLPIVPGLSPFAHVTIPTVEPLIDDPVGMVATEESPTQEDRIAEAQAAILLSLSRGAAQGLIEIAEVPLPDYSVPTVAEVVPIAPEPDQPLASEANIVLHAQTSVDRDSMSVPSAVPLTLNGDRCLPNAMFDVPVWGDDRPFGLQVAAWREQLFGEFDAEQVRAVDGLARTYIYFGFGREARALLDTSDVVSHERQVLRALAQIMDGLETSDDMLRDQIECDSAVALWAILATNDISQNADIDITAVQFAFARLPMHLKTHLGPLLSRKLLEAGDTVAADAILRVATRYTDEGTIETELAAAEILLQEGDLDGAIAQLSTLAEQDSRLTPEGVVALIDLQLSQGETVLPSTIELAAALEFEHKSRPVSQDLLRVRLDALAANSEFVELFEAIDSQAEEWPDRMVRLSLGMMELAERGDDLIFLKRAFEYGPDDIDPAAQNSTAARLMSLGFFDQAARFLHGDVEREDSAERRFLRAELAAQVGDTAVVMAVLSGITSERAQGIMTTAFERAGDYETLVLSATAPTDPAVQSTYEWRAGAWPRLRIQNVDPLLQTAALYMTGEGTSVDPAAPPLEQDLDPGSIATPIIEAGLLEETAQARATIDALLLRFPNPQDMLN